MKYDRGRGDITIVPESASVKFNDLPSERVQRIYDRLARLYAGFDVFESRAKERALATVASQPGGRLLEVGTGAGGESRRLREHLGAGARLVGVDLSFAMARRSAHVPGSYIIQAGVTHLPFVPGAFDQIYCSYVLDLLPQQTLPGVLAGLRRTLRPEGRLTLLYLSEGVDLATRSVVALWRAAYHLSPALCAGCRPLSLAGLVEEAGFRLVSCETIVQWGVPSQLIQAINTGS